MAYLLFSHTIHFSESLPGLFLFIYESEPITAPCGVYFPDMSYSPELVTSPRPAAPYCRILDFEPEPCALICLCVCKCTCALAHL